MPPWPAVPAAAWAAKVALKFAVGYTRRWGPYYVFKFSAVAAFNRYGASRAYRRILEASQTHCAAAAHRDHVRKATRTAFRLPSELGTLARDRDVQRFALSVVSSYRSEEAARAMKSQRQEAAAAAAVAAAAATDIASDAAAKGRGSGAELTQLHETPRIVSARIRRPRIRRPRMPEFIIVAAEHLLRWRFNGANDANDDDRRDGGDGGDCGDCAPATSASAGPTWSARQHLDNLLTGGAITKEEFDCLVARHSAGTAGAASLPPALKAPFDDATCGLEHPGESALRGLLAEGLIDQDEFEQREKEFRPVLPHERSPLPAGRNDSAGQAPSA